MLSVEASPVPKVKARNIGRLRKLLDLREAKITAISSPSDFLQCIRFLGFDVPKPRPPKFRTYPKQRCFFPAGR